MRGGYDTQLAPRHAPGHPAYSLLPTTSPCLKLPQKGQFWKSALNTGFESHQRYMLNFAQIILKSEIAHVVKIHELFDCGSSTCILMPLNLDEQTDSPSTLCLPEWCQCSRAHLVHSLVKIVQCVSTRVQGVPQQ